MKILVTGANGQLGSELKKQCTHEFIGADLPQFDITKLNFVQNFLNEVRPDIIINCAAFTDVDKCENVPDFAYSVNALGARNIAIATEKIGAKIIHISTDYVFDGYGDTAKKEWEIPAPQSVYGYTKLAGENFVREFSSKYFIVRTAWLYGTEGNNFVKTILNAAKAGKPLKVVDDQIGNPTNASDLAEHLLKLAETEEYGVYHCTNNGESSWYDFACEFLKLSGLQYEIEPCSTAEFPRPARRPAYSSLDNMMLRLTIGDEMRHWKDAIADFMRGVKL